MTPPNDESQRGAGRPRDPRIEQAALAATRDLLVEVGSARLTVAAVAGRAGTTKAALYRRWPSLPHLVYEAAFPDELLKDWHLGPDLRADLLGIVIGTRDAFTTPVAAAAALPGCWRSSRRTPRCTTRCWPASPVSSRRSTNGCARPPTTARCARTRARRTCSD